MITIIDYYYISVSILSQLQRTISPPRWDGAFEPNSFIVALETVLQLDDTRKLNGWAFREVHFDVLDYLNVVQLDVSSVECTYLSTLWVQWTVWCLILYISEWINIVWYIIMFRHASGLAWLHGRQRARRQVRRCAASWHRHGAVLLHKGGLQWSDDHENNTRRNRLSCYCGRLAGILLVTTLLRSDTLHCCANAYSGKTNHNLLCDISWQPCFSSSPQMLCSTQAYVLLDLRRSLHGYVMHKPDCINTKNIMDEHWCV